MKTVLDHAVDGGEGHRVGTLLTWTGDRADRNEAEGEFAMASGAWKCRGNSRRESSGSGGRESTGNGVGDSMCSKEGYGRVAPLVVHK